MTITYNDNRVINPIEEILLNFTYAVVSIFKPISRLPLFISWILGMILLVTLGFLYTIIFYLPLLASRKKINSDVKALIKNIDRFSESEAMELHIEFESLRKRMDKIVHKGNHFFVFTPIMHEIRKTSAQIKNAEETLFVKAYPDYENPLTKEQSEELYGLMRSWREDEKTNMEI